MKKIICIILAVIFYILGIIGLCLPIIPQVPFLVLGFFFSSIASKKFKEKVMGTNFYKKHIEEHVLNNKFLEFMFKD